MNLKDKYLFLDIDGVLNSNEYYVRRETNEDFKKHRLSKKFSEVTDNKWEFDPIAVERLNRIIKETKAKIVVSSTWRTIPNIEQILKDAGIKGKVIGITSSFWWKDIARNEPFVDGHCSIPRGLEIEEWLCANFKYSDRYSIKYCIIDDDDDMLYRQKDNFVRTDWWFGLTDEDADKVIKILNKGEKNERS